MARRGQKNPCRAFFYHIEWNGATSFAALLFDVPKWVKSGFSIDFSGETDYNHAWVS